MYWKHLWSIMIYILILFLFLADCDQNYMQMINLKKLLGCWPFQIIQNFRNSSRSCAIFIFNITCRSSLRTLNVLYSVFECADPMHNIHIFKLWSNYSKIGLLFYVFWTFIKPLKRSVGFAYNSSNLDHWISQLQGICGDQQLPRVLRGWCVAQYFPLFWNKDFWLWPIHFPIEIFISFVCYEIGIV